MVVLPPCKYPLFGDGAFALKTNLLKPYPKETIRQSQGIFNYRLSRARHIIENCFGIAASRFRIFRRPIIAEVETAVGITKAVVALHNYLMYNKSQAYYPTGYVDCDMQQGRRPGDWRMTIAGDSELRPVARIGSNNYTRNAKEVRDDFRDFFSSSAGEVPRQWNIL